LSRDPAEIYNLLHSLARALPPPGYSAIRPYVFSLLLNNGSTHLFHAPSSADVIDWVRCINYWAARRSKEPMRGGVGSTEYGWGAVAFRKRMKEKEERERKEREEALIALMAKKGTVDEEDANGIAGGNGSGAVSAIANVTLQSSAASVRSVSTTTVSSATSDVTSGTKYSGTWTKVTGNGGSVVSSSSAGAAAASGGGGDVIQPLPGNKKIKIAEWVAPSGVGYVVSLYDEVSSSKLVVI
ncbi:hypothetical protein HK102_012963, partial [Quaeritorhiza haematococci]